MSMLFHTSFSDPGIIPRATVEEALYTEKQIGNLLLVFINNYVFNTFIRISYALLKACSNLDCNKSKLLIFILHVSLLEHKF